ARRWRGAALAVALLLAVGAGEVRAETVAQRYPALADKLQCTCGCDTPMRFECETMRCTMRARIDADIVRVETGPMRKQPMSLILQAFEQKYGSRILLAPPTTGFSLVVWIMPWVAAGLGLWLVLFSIQYWRKRGPLTPAAPVGAADSSAPAPPEDEAALAQVRAEMDRELRGL
ncbi:MAG: cytochrome c-type biogenesis protein CcmH, partial [Terriglobales bacterium]